MNIKLAQGDDEINSTGGIILVGKLLELNAWEKINDMTTARITRGEISHSDILKIAAALLALGKTDFADIDLYRNDPLFKKALDLNLGKKVKIPSRIQDNDIPEKMFF